MSEESDPLLTFFSASEAAKPDILYTTLGVPRTATVEETRKAYRKAALRCHPDKHAGKPEAEVQKLHVEFQKVGFAWAVLSDEKRRKRYDTTGRTDDLKFGADDEAGWEAYFEDLFERVDRKMMDDHKATYQGSEEELEDIRSAYDTNAGSFPGILDYVPHCTVDDEERFVTIIEAEIKAGRLERNSKWTKTSTDAAAAKKRKAKAERDAKKAEKAAKELGLWDEFYGSGKKGKRARDDDKENKGKGKDKAEAEAEDSSLMAMIQRRQQGRMSVIDALEEKYSNLEKEKSKKRKGSNKKQEPEVEAHPADLDDDAFAALQAKMFGDKSNKRKTK